MRKPTRRDLLVVIGRLQNLFGAIPGVANDRNPHRAAQLEAIAQRGFNLCIEALGFDAPQKESGPWADVDGKDQAWRKAG